MVTTTEPTTEPINIDAPSDEQLVERIRSGETDLFELLMRRHNTRVYRAARAILRDDAEAEDVMQEAYVRAFVHLDQFRGNARFSTWLVKIAVYEAFARVRKRAHLAPVEALHTPRQESDAMSVFFSERRDPESAASARETRALLEDAIDALPERYRTVFVLRDVNELSTAEAAACLSITEQALKTRLHRARTLLRDELYARAGRAANDLFEFAAPRCDRVVASVMSRIRRAG